MNGNASDVTAEQATAPDAAGDYELQRLGSDDWADAAEHRWRDQVTSVRFNVIVRQATGCWV